ncbi:MAG: hypothetical protein WCO29_00940 [Nostocales cyanobacterium ELA583]|jgi:hypothetical protein
MNRNQERMTLQLLNILIQEQSILLETIAKVLDEDEYDVKVILDKWREFLHLEIIEEKINYSFYHVSFRDWLKQKAEEQ